RNRRKILPFMHLRLSLRRGQAPAHPQPIKPMQPVRLLFIPAALTLASGPLFADGDGPSAMAALSTNEALIGSTVDITLSSPLPGSAAVFAFGFTPAPIVLGGALPVLHVGVPFTTPSGFIGPDG